jgi:LytS/YehU family sensor histidine kinase
LNNSDKSLVPLDSELSSLRLYIELESLRLHLNFDYCIEVNETIVQEIEMVPPLVLQPYAENALWHGLSNKEGERKLHININTDEEFLICEIKDNGIGRIKADEIKSKNTAANTSKGLDITRRRLSLMNDESASPVIIEDLYEDGNPSGTKVVLKIRRHFVV